jgi:hypothetical protein
MFALIFILSACGEVKTYPNLTYQHSHTLTARQTDIYVFTNQSGEEVILYQQIDSSYRNLLEKGQKYDVTVTVEDNLTSGDYIQGITKSK